MAPNLLKSFPVSHFYEKTSSKKVNSPNKLTRQIFPLKNTTPNFHPTPGGEPFNPPLNGVMPPWQTSQKWSSSTPKGPRSSQDCGFLVFLLGGKHLWVFRVQMVRFLFFFFATKNREFPWRFFQFGTAFFLKVYHGWWFLPAKQVVFHCNARLLESRIYNNPDIVWDDLRQLIWLWLFTAWFETFRGYPCSKFKCQLGRTMKRHLGNKKTLYTWMGLYWHVDETCRDVAGPYESVWNKKCRWVVPCKCVSTLQNHWKSKGPVMTGREQAELSKKSDNPHQTTEISSWPTWTPLALDHALMVYS